MRKRRRFSDSFGNAIAGIAEAVRREGHMRFHLAAALAVIITAGYLQVTRGEWLWLLAAIAAVWISELLNTAIERAVDLASPDFHPLAKAAKDTAAGAVLVAAMFALIVGILILGPRLRDLFFQ